MIIKEFSKVISQFNKLSFGKEKTFYGFVWADNSCAFDTISTILMYSYQRLCKVFTDNWKDLNNLHFTHFELIFRDNFSSNLLKIKVNKLVSNASKSAVHNLDQLEFPSGIEHNIDKIFRYLIETSNNWYQYEHPLFQLLIKENYDIDDVHKIHCEALPFSQNDSQINHKSIQNIIFTKYQILESSSSRKRSRRRRVTSYQLIKSPYILAIKIINEITICSTITLFDVKYTFFAIVYTINKHFTAVIKIGKILYEYDGMSDNGKFKKIEDTCISYKYNEGNACMSFYLKNNLSDL